MCEWQTYKKTNYKTQGIDIVPFLYISLSISIYIYIYLCLSLCVCVGTVHVSWHFIIVIIVFACHDIVEIFGNSHQFDAGRIYDIPLTCAVSF